MQPTATDYHHEGRGTARPRPSVGRALWTPNNPRCRSLKANRRAREGRANIRWSGDPGLRISCRLEPLFYPCPPDGTPLAGRLAQVHGTRQNRTPWRRCVGGQPSPSRSCGSCRLLHGPPFPPSPVAFPRRRGSHSGRWGGGESERTTDQRMAGSGVAEPGQWTKPEAALHPQPKNKLGRRGGRGCPSPSPPSSTNGHAPERQPRATEQAGCPHGDRRSGHPCRGQGGGEFCPAADGRATGGIAESR